MASLEKHTASQVKAILLHNTRESTYPASNKEIDPNRSHLNKHLDTVGTTYKDALTKYKELVNDSYIYGRKDVKTLVSWCISEPKDLAPDQSDIFWKETMNFLGSKYGPENCVQAILHYDEGVFNPVTNSLIGAKCHLHYCWVPRVPDTNPKHSQEYKIASSTYTGIKDLINFHTEYQDWLNKAGIRATVKYSNPGEGRKANYTSVSTLKEQTKKEMALEKEICSLRNENAILKSATTNINRNPWGGENIWKKDLEI